MHVAAVGFAPLPTGATLQSLGPATRWNRPGRAAWLAATAGARLVVAIDPELWVPVLMAQRARRALAVADVHEDFAALATDHDRWGPPVVRHAVATGVSALGQALDRFDAVVVADHHLPPQAPRRRIVGRNIPDPADYEVTADNACGLRAVYAGDLTPQRGLQAMLDGVLASPDWSLDVFGPDRAWATDTIAEAVARGGNRIRYRGHVTQDELISVLPTYDVGLCLLDRIPSYDAALPSKVLEYQAAGLATVATDLSRVTVALTESDSGVVVDADADVAGQLALALADLGQNPDRLAQLQRNGRAAAISGGQADSLAEAVRTVAAMLER